MNFPSEPLSVDRSIVIIGYMNPAIHHPAWYEAVSILSETERDEALASKREVIATQQIAQFSTNNFSVFCNNERWQIGSNSIDSARIMKLAIDTFDRLKDTPVKAYGVNFNLDFKATDDVPRLLVQEVRRMRFGLPEDETGLAASISYVAEGPNCKFKTVIGTSKRGSNFVNLRNNAHFDISPTETTPIFDLGPLITNALSLNEERAYLIKNRLIQNLKD